MQRILLERGCPRCSAPMPIAALSGGESHCGSCSLDFVAAVFEPKTRAGLQPPDASAVAAAQCSKHPRNAAVAACDRCGVFICSLCRVDGSGATICTACFEKAQSDDRQSTTYRDWRAVSLLLAAGCVVFWVGGVLMGPATVLTAVAARNQARRWGDEVSLFTFAGRILVGLCTTIAGVFFAATLFSK